MVPFMIDEMVNWYGIKNIALLSDSSKRTKFYKSSGTITHHTNISIEHGVTINHKIDV